MSGAVRGLLVALEGSTRRASVALRRAELVLDLELDPERAHQSDLLPAIDGLVRRAGARPSEISAVIVGTGPGSYTGLRVAIATALGLARAAGARVLGLPSGEAACLAVCADGEELVTLSDARSGALYHGRWRRVGRDVTVVEPARVVAVEAASTVDVSRAHILCDMPDLVPDAFRSRIRADVVPRAKELLELGAARLARGIETPPGTLEPLYLRPFAVSERKR